MFTTIINDVDHKIFFKHEKQPGEHPTATKCIVLNKETGDIVTESEAKCNPIDRFEYAVGRKIALERALKNASFTREQRSAVWAAYNNK